jgi:hypothetical protein
MPCLQPLRPIALVGLLLSSFPASAAPQEWALQHGTELYDTVTDISHDGAGGAFVAGYRYMTFDPGSPRAFLQRVASGGQIAWTQDLGDPFVEDFGYSVALDGAGGAVFAGSTRSKIGAAYMGQLDAFVVNYDGQGQLLWAQQFGTTRYEEAFAICADGAGGYFLAGHAYGGFGGGPAGATVAFLMRLDGNGNPQWTTTIGSAGTTTPHSICVDGAGGFYVCGRTSDNLTGTGSGTGDGWLARMSATGGVLWLRQFGGIGYDIAHAVALAPDLGAFVGGQLGGATFAETDGFLRRFDSSGALVWSVVTGLGEYNEIADLVPNGSGGVFVCGAAVAPVPPGEDAWYASYSGDGASEFIKYVGHPFSPERGTAIDTDGGSGLMLAGWTNGSLYAASASPGMSDTFLAHYDACELDPWTVYCTSTPNSTGKVASIGAYGSVRVTNNDFTLVTSSCPSDMLGLFLMSTTPGSTPFGNGVLCLGGSVLRLLPAVSTGFGGSSAYVALDFGDPSSSAAQVTPGSTWNFQLWFRDVAAFGAEFNLSNALSATFCP